jgi:hypothetical protein
MHSFTAPIVCASVMKMEVTIASMSKKQEIAILYFRANG